MPSGICGRVAWTLDVSVVLDLGFWSRVKRDRFRAEVEALGRRTSCTKLFWIETQHGSGFGTERRSGISDRNRPCGVQ